MFSALPSWLFSPWSSLSGLRGFIPRLSAFYFCGFRVDPEFYGVIASRVKLHHAGSLVSMAFADLRGSGFLRFWSSWPIDFGLLGLL